MYAVGNALASIPGLVLPPLGVYLARAANGSWTPLFGMSRDVCTTSHFSWQVVKFSEVVSFVVGLCSAITMVTGIAFHQTASLTSGRELLAQREVARKHTVSSKGR